MQPTRTEVLRLYKELLRYGEMLVLTDKKYYQKRIKREFLTNKESTGEDSKFLYENVAVSERQSTAREKEISLIMLCRSSMNKICLFRVVRPLLIPNRGKAIDKSKVPVLDERDLKERFIRGGGPGGQNVNKTNNCVYLCHMPTGLSVKVHESRCQNENRKLARQKLTILLDNLINNEHSVEQQKQEILQEKSLKKIQKRKKLTELKDKWKQLMSEYS